MHKPFIFLFLNLLPGYASGADRTEGDTVVYLFPGQGSDERLFKHLELPQAHDTVHISYPVPEKHESLADYALRFLAEILKQEMRN